VINDPTELQRFVDAQRDTYEGALRELRHGAKEGHWIWFIFPQIAGLGSSAMASRYAIKSRQEAQAYLSHSILGPRLAECAKALLGVEGKSTEEIMGDPDHLKLRSSMTLFAAVLKPHSVFHAVLDRYYNGEADDLTMELLRRSDSA
jgi:uncharacterized protein (DUF1810 family)